MEIDINELVGHDSKTAVTDDDRHFVAEVIKTYGPTTRRLASGRIELNHVTMARILARPLGLVYDTSARAFLHRRANGDLTPLSSESVALLVGDALQQIAARHPEFPMIELRPQRIARMVDIIKLSAGQMPDPYSGLMKFVRTGLCIKPGNSLTSEEIFITYREFTARRRLPVYGRTQFDRQLKSLILKVFCKTQSNSLLRRSGNLNKLTSRRGYKEMALSDTMAHPGTPGTQGTPKAHLG